MCDISNILGFLDFHLYKRPCNWVKSVFTSHKRLPRLRGVTRHVPGVCQPSTYGQGSWVTRPRLGKVHVLFECWCFPHRTSELNLGPQTKHGEDGNRSGIRINITYEICRLLLLQDKLFFWWHHHLQNFVSKIAIYVVYRTSHIRNS